MKYTYLVVCVAVVAALGVTESEAFRLSGSPQRSDSLQARSEEEDHEPSEETFAIFDGLTRICVSNAYNKSDASDNSDIHFVKICNGIINVKDLFVKCKQDDGIEEMGKLLNKHKELAKCVLLSAEDPIPDECEDKLQFEKENVDDEVEEFEKIYENECVGNSEERELESLFRRLLDEVKHSR